jgi:hypothetical protein
MLMPAIAPMTSALDFRPFIPPCSLAKIASSFKIAVQACCSRSALIIGGPPPSDHDGARSMPIRSFLYTKQEESCYNNGFRDV